MTLDSLRWDVAGRTVTRLPIPVMELNRSSPTAKADCYWMALGRQTPEKVFLLYVHDPAEYVGGVGLMWCSRYGRYPYAVPYIENQNMLSPPLSKRN
jgi:hypothetical protein